MNQRIKAIIFDMDNTLFDFVAAKQHACREVAKELRRDDWDALFTCFINSPHGFESHENIRDYFDLCGLLEQCSSGKNPDSDQAVTADNPLPEKGNVVRIQISQVTRSPAKDSPTGISVPSAIAISPDKGKAQPPLVPVRDNLAADRSLYCNEVFARCCEIYEAEKIRVLEPYPGVRETLAELKNRGLPLAIVTDAHNGNALLRLHRTGLAEFFDHVVTYDMTGAKKPAPDAFLLTLKKLCTKPAETLLVGDSIRRDIVPAKELGMITAYAAYGDRNVRSRDPKGVRPDYVLNDIRELLV